MTAPDPAAVPVVDPSDQLELKLPGESRDWREIGLWAGALALLALVAFWPAVNGRFLWLDNAPVAGNVELVKPGGLGRAWTDRWTLPTSTYAATSTVYRPVAFTVYWLTYSFGGHDANNAPTPTAYHVVGLAFHAAAAVLAWLALRELAVPGAWLAAALFALHPANAEAASWIRDQPVVVGGALFFGAAYAYLRFVAGRDRDAAARRDGIAAGSAGGADPAQTWGLYAAAVALYGLACLAWPAAFVLPVVLASALWWRHRLARPEPLLLGGPLVVGLGLFLANFELQRYYQQWHGGLKGLVGLAGTAPGFAAIDLFAPVHLSILYPVRSLTPYIVAVSVVVLAAVVIAAVVRSVGRGPLVATLAFVACAVPAANYFEPPRLTRLADPILYLAALPVLAGVVGAVASRVGRRVPVAVGLSSVVIAAMAVGGWSRARTFAGNLTLWQDTADKFPEYPLAQAAAAEQFRLAAEAAALAGEPRAAVDADLDQAVARAKATVALPHRDDEARTAVAMAYQTWGTVDLSRNDSAAARAHYKMATNEDPRLAAAHVQYAAMLVYFKEWNAARSELNLALETLGTSPASATAHRLLGQVFGGLGTPDDLRRSVNESDLAVQLGGGDPADREAYADALLKVGRFREAIGQYGQLMQADPAQQRRPDLWNAVATARVGEGAASHVPAEKDADFGVAVQYFKVVKQLDPKFPDIDGKIARTEARIARVKAATREAAATRAATRPAATGPATGTATTRRGTAGAAGR